MTQKEYLIRFHEVITKMYDTTVKKNSDYAEEDDAFANFRMIDQMTSGRISTEAGIVTRLTDKLKRIASLISRPAKVQDESVQDTILDMAVYSIILYIWMTRDNKQNAASENAIEVKEWKDLYGTTHQR
jgi:hypothetical protein